MLLDPRVLAALFHYYPESDKRLKEYAMEADWVIATLTDALEALASVIEDAESDPDSLAELLPLAIPAVYAKLNYAWNSRELGPQAIETIDHDALVAFPRDLPF